MILHGYRNMNEISNAGSRRCPDIFDLWFYKSYKLIIRRTLRVRMFYLSNKFVGY